MRTFSVMLGCALAAGGTAALAQQTDSEWQAQLQGQGQFSDLSGTAQANATDGRTIAATTVRGAAPDGTHPWHIHEGRCGSGGGIVGDPGAYEPLEPGAEGNALAQATVDVALEQGEDYHVNVHASPDDLATIIACGDLRRQR